MLKYNNEEPSQLTLDISHLFRLIFVYGLLPVVSLSFTFDCFISTE